MGAAGIAIPPWILARADEVLSTEITKSRRGILRPSNECPPSTLRRLSEGLLRGTTRVRSHGPDLAGIN
jgi:hypothetical protein